jgi:hypothetical protein
MSSPCVIPKGVNPNTAWNPNAVGANELQNYPVLQSASAFGSGTTVTGSLNSEPNTTFRLEFFSNAATDSTGYGQGQTYIGFANVTTDASGNASFTASGLATVPAGQGYISATATNLTTGDTSEFSADVLAPVSSGGPYNISEGNALTLHAAAPPPGSYPWTYSWDLHGNGVFGDASSPNPNLTLSWAQLQALSPPITDGQYTVRAQVSDGQGSVITLPPATLTVSDTGPTASISTTLPTDGSGNPTSPEGTPITLSGSALDPSAADTAAGHYAWAVWKHATPTSPATTLTHALQYATHVIGFSSELQPTQIYGPNAYDSAEALGPG